MHTTNNITDKLRQQLPPSRVALPRETGERRSGGGVKTIEGGGRVFGGRVLLVVFDDDPTGIQTVHSCLLVTNWSEENLVRAFEDEAPFFYVLTNSRALTAADARRVLTDAVEAVVRVNKRYGYRLICISRSDSCLRGHFPLETDVMREVLTRNNIKVWEKTPFCPAFIESGRVTIDGAHYMVVPAAEEGEENRLVPVSETEFARDNVFGYKSSVLTEYIREKGADPADYDIINAQSYDELYSYCDRFFAEMEEHEGAVVIRSSSSLPKALSGIPDKPMLTPEDLGISGGAGLFIVGSHVKKTTEQLEALLTCEGVKGMELPIDAILNDSEALLHDTLQLLANCISEGITPVVYTSRKEVRIDDADKRQHLGQTVSNFLVSIVRHLPVTPAYLVAKGGITSHDILTHGLCVKVGRVMGQAINSVPCVMAELNGKPVPYIIFPGNVGNKESLKEVYLKNKRIKK